MKSARRSTLGWTRVVAGTESSLQSVSHEPRDKKKGTGEWRRGRSERKREREREKRRAENEQGDLNFAAEKRSCSMVRGHAHARGRVRATAYINEPGRAFDTNEPRLDKPLDP